MVPRCLLCRANGTRDGSGYARHKLVAHRPIMRFRCVVDVHMDPRIVECGEFSRCGLELAPSALAFGRRFDCAASGQAVGMVVQSEAGRFGECGNDCRRVGLSSIVVASPNFLAVWLKERASEPHRPLGRISVHAYSWDGGALHRAGELGSPPGTCGN
jgi:hypothetical protein